MNGTLRENDGLQCVSSFHTAIINNVLLAVYLRLKIRSLIEFRFHRKLRQISEAQAIITNQIICTKCGGAGHIARDCVQKTPAELVSQQLVTTGNAGDLPANTVTVRQDRAKMDSEYMSLMAELGQVSRLQFFFSTCVFET